tara:strand:+ start:18833 stop:19999 length:1167 start_codon:yes stop_codon:yes gene_type:complete
MNTTNSPIISNSDSELLISLDQYPVTEIYQQYGSNSFPFNTSFDQELRFCPKTNHAFMSHQLPQEFIYNSENYNTHSSTSIGSLNALDNFFNFIQSDGDLSSDAVIDIGANDTTLLKRFSGKAQKLVGIDPNINSDDRDIECIKDFFENVDIQSISPNKKTFLSSHTLEHIYDPRKFMQILSESTNENDSFFFQFPSIDLLIRDSRFDQLHHQHLHLFSIQSFSQLIADFGFKIVKYQFDPDHYGTLMVQFKKTQNEIKIFEYENGFYSIEEIKRRYEIFLQNISLANERILQDEAPLYCYGASLMLPIISYYIPEMKKAIKIIDTDSSKSGLSYVNFDVEIVNGSGIDLTKANVLITALATKFATRKIANVLSELKAMNIILPLNTI